MTDTQTAFVLASQIAADVMGNDHLAHLLDEQQADEVHSHVQEAVLKALLSAAPKPPESEIGPVAWRVWDDILRSWILSYKEEVWPDLLVNEPLYPQARIDADAATIAALLARAEAAEARVKELEAAIGGCHCPRPFNSRPHGFTISECVGAGECGCSDGAALASKKETVDE